MYSPRALVPLLLLAVTVFALPLSVSGAAVHDSPATGATTVPATGTPAASLTTGASTSTPAAGALTTAPATGALTTAPATGALTTAPTTDAATTQEAAPDPDERDDDPTTAGTIGYVEGYWYDDELPVDEREGATPADEDELEAVVYRSMARVETIRERTFEEPVSVDVIGREEFRNESDDLVQLTDRDRFVENVRHEATFLVDRDTDVVDVYRSLQGDAVGGYYDPTTDETVLVAADGENPAVDEPVLGHELVHALQDQHFDLTSFERETFDRDAATNGLVEGDAALVQAEYERRCGVEWECLDSETRASIGDDFHEGVFYGMYQPYEDGPDYVAHLRNESGGDWGAVDARYADPPASAAEVIRPGETREPVDVDLADRSTDDWVVLEPDEGATAETFGEVGVVAMFADGASTENAPSVLSPTEFFAGQSGAAFEYDQPRADGWAGDELVVYGSASAVSNETGGEDPDAFAADSLDETGFVWRSEWESSDDAAAFLDGYVQLLAFHGAETVDDRRDTVVIDDGYPGAYAVQREAETVTIVRAPSVADLSAVRDGAAPAGEDTLDFDVDADDGGTGDGASDGNGGNPAGDGGDATGDDGAGDAGDTIPGFGVAVAVVATLVVAQLLARSVRRR